MIKTIRKCMVWKTILPQIATIPQFSPTVCQFYILTEFLFLDYSDPLIYLCIQIIYVYAETIYPRFSRTIQNSIHFIRANGIYALLFIKDLFAYSFG